MEKTKIFYYLQAQSVRIYSSGGHDDGAVVAVVSNGGKWVNIFYIPNNLISKRKKPKPMLIIGLKTRGEKKPNRITEITAITETDLPKPKLPSFENSYIPENPRTPKPLTFSKNRLRGAKNRSNISPVAKIFFRKNDFFFPKTLHMSLYNTYLKSCTYAQKIKKSCTYAKVKKKYRFFGNFFQRIVMIKNVLEGSEVGFLKGITVWEI
ncbi:hypothetical protein LXL04_038204 [Taraxacum kok-saghyz]